MPEIIEKEIPKAEEGEVVAVQKGDLGKIGEIKNRLDQISGLLFAIVASVVISAIAALIAVIGIFWDQMRFNNAAYREYSKSTQTLETLLESNKALLREIENDQEIIKKLSEQSNNSIKK